MPRSKRRKGVKPHANRGKGRSVFNRDPGPRFRYDPSTKPFPKNYKKHAQQAARPRKNARGK